ncbi:MAG: InlB B-repeat-containing protein [Clostridiales Family XIII bacterium]|jgi:uncharacterized repeat protein (TIGR02543 family)|nr:InlB B-repeat-containing protein [Clostridiales Family XIII bacterium]
MKQENTKKKTMLVTRLLVCLLMMLLIATSMPPLTASAATEYGPLTLAPSSNEFNHRFSEKYLNIPQKYWYSPSTTSDSKVSVLEDSDILSDKDTKDKIKEEFGMSSGNDNYYYFEAKGSGGISVSNLRWYSFADAKWYGDITMTVKFSDASTREETKGNIPAVLISKGVSADPNIRIYRVDSVDVSISYSRSVDSNMEFWDIDGHQSVAVSGVDGWYVGKDSKLLISTGSDSAKFVSTGEMGTSLSLKFMAGVIFSGKKIKITFTGQGDAHFTLRKAAYEYDPPPDDEYYIRYYANGSSTNPASIPSVVGTNGSKSTKENGEHFDASDVIEDNALPPSMLTTENKPTRPGCILGWGLSGSTNWYAGAQNNWNDAILTNMESKGTSIQNLADNEKNRTVHVYARWSANLTFDPQGGTVSDPAKNPATPATGLYKTSTSGGNAVRTYYFGSTGVAASSFPEPTRDGYDFEGWYTSASGGEKKTSLTVEKNTTLYARWKEIITDEGLTFDPQGGTVSEPAQNPTPTPGTFRSVTSGGKVVRTYYVGVNPVTAVNFPTPTRAGYTFVGWHSARTSGVAKTSQLMDGNYTLYARWSSDLVFKANGGFVSEPAQDPSPKNAGAYKSVTSSDRKTLTRTYYSSATLGTATGFPTPTRPDFEFLGWYTVQAYTGGEEKTSVEIKGGTVTLYARWKRVQPEITILPDTPSYPADNPSGGNPNGVYTYHTDTDVITAIDIKTTGDIYPDPAANRTDADGNAVGTLKVKFSLGSSSFLWRGIVIPKGGTQRVWLKWHTPSYATDIDILVEADALVDRWDFFNTSDYTKGYKTMRLTAHIIPLSENTPPNPEGEDTNPYGSFSPESSSPSVPGSNRTSAAWSKHAVSVQYDAPTNEIAPLSWSKLAYSATLSAGSKIVPSRRVPTAELVVGASGKYRMKSAYGVEAQIAGSSIMSASAGSQIAYDYSVLQYGRAFFPEFLYSAYDRLMWRQPRVMGGADNLTSNEPLIFSRNRYSQYSDPVHFTPIWYPDGKPYAVYVYAFDAWTPVGELRYLSSTTNDITIDGDAYDDWHIAPTS